MVDEELVTADQLDGFPGAPFPTAALSAAADSVRVDAGWHIAPIVTQTVEIDTDRSRVALLPSLRVIEVISVTNVDTDEEITGWRLSKHRGTLTLKGGRWPEQIEVALKHGYEACPPALFPVIAERVQRGRAGLAVQESLGSRSVSYRQQYDPVSAGILGRFTIPGRP